MQERFGVPVGLDNDANAAAIGEWKAGAARGATDVVMLTLGTGVGGGVISGGAPFRGGGGAGVELGHTVVLAHGPPCQGACTGHGHLEVLASGEAATAAAREAFGPGADAHRLVRLANEGDATAKEILARIGDYVGIAMGSFANIFNPQLIVVGGGFGFAAWDPYAECRGGAAAGGVPARARGRPRRSRRARHVGRARRSGVRRLRGARPGMSAGE